ncbi:MAG TPA: 50S ribosomal protein L18 [Persephonella sp.]|uniref:Large ribosomal subunit protein uL18 n=1 Tax=Persephonella marina (strain DSM 14350 / EX-H1) TaxID=123214 RepID=C0QQN9_PERMH|nr:MULTISPECIES: 50S ribosomal protein L18 [Persephonella]ACO04325.1 ribosomal protein L18 [Persephonella marina EX-H1]HCB68736.1 50S ribosomal protein L18 [Persephonella sp.]
MAVKTRREKRLIRHKRIRKKVFGTAERPRMAFFKSLNNLYVQIIDDEAGHTLVSASTIDKDFVEKYGVRGGKNIEMAKKLGEFIAEKALAKGIQNVVFDRGGFIYHGKVKAFADAAREKGLKF